MKIKCDSCRKETNKKLSAIRRSKTHFCSYSCRSTFLRGIRAANWKGDKLKVGLYMMVYQPDHPKANLYGRIFEHRAVAEKCLGRRIDTRHPIHHMNEDTIDNRPENLVVCESNAYHRLLHRRLRVLRAGGNPKTDKICTRCKQVKHGDDFGSLWSNYDGLDRRCKNCVRIHNQRRRKHNANFASD